MPPSAYLLEGDKIDLPGYCIFGVSGGLDSTYKMYIFGQVFLRSFYSVYDFENSRLGMALHPWSKGTIDHETNTWLIIGIVVLAIAIIGGVIFYIVKNRKSQEE